MVQANSTVRWGARFIAFLLVAGGILGIIAAIGLVRGFADQGKPYRVIVPLISVAVFLWGALKGIDLWRGKPAGYKWAKILFAMQVPAFSVGQVAYEYSTGVSARVLFGNSTRKFGADIGSSLNLLISSERLGWMLGVNIVALVVLAYLLRVSPSNRTQ